MTAVNRRRRKKLSARLVWAASSGDLPGVTALLRAGAPAETADAEGTTPLYAAAVQGNGEVAEALLAAGAHPDTESGRGQEGTPLCAAACRGNTGTVRTLLAHGADPLLREDGGTGLSPLDWALRESHAETIALLLAAPRPEEGGRRLTAEEPVARHRQPPRADRATVRAEADRFAGGEDRVGDGR